MDTLRKPLPHTPKHASHTPMSIEHKQGIDPIESMPYFLLYTFSLSAYLVAAAPSLQRHPNNGPYADVVVAVHDAAVLDPAQVVDIAGGIADCAWCSEPPEAEAV